MFELQIAGTMIVLTAMFCCSLWFYHNTDKGVFVAYVIYSLIVFALVEVWIFHY